VFEVLVGVVGFEPATATTLDALRLGLSAVPFRVASRHDGLVLWFVDAYRELRHLLRYLLIKLVPNRVQKLGSFYLPP
jgi:hypothetical protein